MALTRARVIAGDEGFGARRARRAVKDILTAKRDPKKVFKDVRAMRELIAQEKGDDDPWDLKLARGGLTDLDFIAQGLVLVSCACASVAGRPLDGRHLRRGSGCGPAAGR